MDIVNILRCEEKEVKPFKRLMKNVVPINYAVTIKPDLSEFTFEGQVDIAVEIKDTAISALVLNRRGLHVSKVEWHCEAGKEDPEFKTDAEDELLTVYFARPLLPMRGTLKMWYTGLITDKMQGFYRSKSTDGGEYYNAVTQFEPTHARQALVCMDDPAIKSKFDVTLVVPKDKIALSNMPVQSETPDESDPSLKVVKFERTPKMSTYLLAWAVGEFDYIEEMSDGVLCRVYTPPGKKEQGRFALDVTIKALAYYKTYFGIAYQLPKLDLLAIADFSFGAMENWGLMTFRETCLLVDDKNTSSACRQSIALIVGHEISHQWFGNLVTPDYWTDLWLKEGFASFIEFLCVDHLFPEYDIWTQFVTESFIHALELDCLKNSHPVEIKVGHPSEIDAIFDDISYCKGATIIRMLHNYIGDETFRKGMNIYLTRHQYENAFTTDLWKALEEASSKPIASVMSTWTTQMGFPLLKISNVRQDESNRCFTITQEKFWSDPLPCDDEEISKDYHWLVPLTFSSSTNPKKVIHEVLLDKKSIDIMIENVEPQQWIKLNPGTIGYYRVQYPIEMLEQFLPSIKSKTMPPLDRLGLLDDLFALVQAGECSTIHVLKLLQSFRHEDNYTVWRSIANIVSKILHITDGSKCHDNVKLFGRTLFQDIFMKVGWEPKQNEDHLQGMLRSLVLSCMAKFHDERSISTACEKFELYLKGEKEIMPDLRAAVYKSVLALGNDDIFNSLVKLYRDSGTMEEKGRIGSSFGAAGNKNLLQKGLEFAISDDVRFQDTICIVTTISAMSKAGRELAWDCFKNHWRLFHKRYIGSLRIGGLVKNICETFVSKEDASEAFKFFQEHSFPGTERPLQQALETVKINEAWVKRDLPIIEEFMGSI